MAKKTRLANLFQALAAHDLDAARQAATAICADEERMGHRGAARLLRSALSTNGATLPRFDVTLGTSSILPALLRPIEVTRNLDEIVLSSAARDELLVLIAEWQHRKKLQTRGLPLRTKLLFHGPPGCGKSITATALGSALNLPVYLVRFDAVIGAYLGQTAIHLRQLFHFIESTPCVLLFDELDALGKRRGNPLDVGELDRIVISLMQELEHVKPAGIIVATSNLPAHLDDALWRRFDLVLSFPRPSKAALRRFIKTLSNRFRLPEASVTKRDLKTIRTFADVERLLEHKARRVVLGK